MLNVTLFAKKDSPACDEARGFLAELQKQYPHRLAEVDVESDSAINMKYGRHVFLTAQMA